MNDKIVGSLFPEPTDKNWKRTMLLGILAEFADDLSPKSYTDTANRIEELFSQKCP